MPRDAFGNTVALKEDQVQLVTNDHGDIPKANAEGYGLYVHDTRFLSTFELLVDNQTPIYLSHSAERNFIATFQFVNPAMLLGDGTRVRRQTISIRRSRFVDGSAFRERIGFYNCNQFPVDLEVMLTFDADFLDIFAVRRYFHQRRGGSRSAKFGPTRLTFSHTGRDRVRRSTIIHFDRRAEPVSSNSMLFRLTLKPHKPEAITIRVEPVDGPGKQSREAAFDVALNHLAESYEEWHRQSTSFETSNEFFDRSLLRQSRFDMRALLEFAEGDHPNGDGQRLVVPSAGIPWYAVPFGRDSVIASLQTLPYNPDIAEGTLRVLARYQGQTVDERTEEEPGKIFHELRRGELANLKEIPHGPYYGTIDATILFVILFVETMAWLGCSEAGLRLYSDLLPAVLRALQWADSYGDLDGDGYVEHRGGQGLLKNQGWKDSDDSLLYPDGSRPEPPVALVEVQGYLYKAKQGLSDLVRRRGDRQLADRLNAEATELKKRFRQDFWMEDESFFAQALDGKKRCVPSVTSNAGHLLWCGILEPADAEAVTRRLMSEDMFSGWGIRTLSSTSPNYNPMSYHNGSVWPHDNSIIASGMRRYGFGQEASEVINGMLSAGLRFPSNRLPELFCGFPRDRRFNSSPAGYIISCSPQAWAAASPFLFLQTLLDIQPLDGNAVRLNPIDMALFSRYTVNHMRVGSNRISFEVLCRGGECRIRGLGGDIEIVSDAASIEP